MNRFIVVLAFSLLTGSTIIGQTGKGVDNQTQKIKDDSSKTATHPRTETDAVKSFDWGKDKTKVRDPLPNPYPVLARRDAVVEAVSQALQDKHILIDEAASRVKEGFIITQPYVFAKGPVTTKSELSRFGQVEYADTAWSRGQYTLTIEVQPVDGTHNNVSVIAKVEGLSGTGFLSEWRTVSSSGLAEDEFLAKLVEMLTGRNPDDQPQQPPKQP
jgi:hypothetical protein